MFQTGYHATGYHATGYHLRGAVIIEPPRPGGGGTGPGVGPGALPSPKPFIKDEPLLLAQALQEDEELLIILEAFVETIRWH